MSRLVCVGDSHAEVFYKIRKSYASLKDTLVLSVPGATNMGIKNPHSKTKARPKIDGFLEESLEKSDTCHRHEQTHQDSGPRETMVGSQSNARVPRFRDRPNLNHAASDQSTRARS